MVVSVKSPERWQCTTAETKILTDGPLSPHDNGVVPKQVNTAILNSATIVFWTPFEV